MKLKEKIKAERKARGWTQEKLATEAGTTKVSVSRWERGEANPRLSQLEGLARAFAQPLSWFQEEISSPLSVVRQDLPPYGLRSDEAEVLAPYIRMLAFIRDASEGQWEIIKGNIETFYRELGGGKRGARRRGGE